MHELSIAGAVLDSVRRETELRPGTRMRKVGLVVGELSGVDSDSLRFCLEALVRDTEFADVSLEISPSPRRHQCCHCGETFTVADYQTVCPARASCETDCISGTELQLSFVELEEQ
ncbi:MAG: hydrogenase maturation nickel metallochaperone HypA [Terriglobales bacterium]